MRIFFFVKQCSGILCAVLLCGIFFLQPMAAAAKMQQQMVRGTVKDANNNPLPGATVAVKGTAQQTTTDAEGSFSINVQDNTAVLVISYNGITTQDIPV